MKIGKDKIDFSAITRHAKIECVIVKYAEPEMEMFGDKLFKMSNGEFIYKNMTMTIYPNQKT